MIKLKEEVTLLADGKWFVRLNTFKEFAVVQNVLLGIFGLL